jgi:hypothetical protein
LIVPKRFADHANSFDFKTAESVSRRFLLIPVAIRTPKMPPFHLHWPSSMENIMKMGSL